MRTLILYYDKDILKNIVAPLTLRPDKIIYLYDSGIRDMTPFRSLAACFRPHMPHLVMEQYPVNASSMEKIYSQTCQVIDRIIGEGYLEVTGGSELMILAGYRAGCEKGIHVIHTDLVHDCITNLVTNEVIAKTETLSLADFIHAKGACFIGESHNPPESDRYTSIQKMARYLFSHLQEWKNTCSYLQTVAARYLPNEVFMESKQQIYMKNGKKICPDKEILKEFQRLGFLKNLVMDGERLHFSYCSINDRQYCTNYGVWLELYVYIAAQQSGVFEDVQLGTMIDWNAYDGVSVAGNEIDVILMDDSMPVFISCKLREADTAALNELLIVKKRVGGWFSKGVMVTFSKAKSQDSGTYKRAQELGLMLLDASDIMAEDFGSRLVKTIHEHDLISMKWKKI